MEYQNILLLEVTYLHWNMTLRSWTPLKINESETLCLREVVLTPLPWPDSEVNNYVLPKALSNCITLLFLPETPADVSCTVLPVEPTYIISSINFNLLSSNFVQFSSTQGCYSPKATASWQRLNHIAIHVISVIPHQTPSYCIREYYAVRCNVK